MFLFTLSVEKYIVLPVCMNHAQCASCAWAPLDFFWGLAAFLVCQQKVYFGAIWGFFLHSVFLLGFTMLWCGLFTCLVAENSCSLTAASTERPFLVSSVPNSSQDTARGCAALTVGVTGGSFSQYVDKLCQCCFVLQHLQKSACNFFFCILFYIYSGERDCYLLLVHLLQNFGIDISAWGALGQLTPLVVVSSSMVPVKLFQQ